MSHKATTKHNGREITRHHGSRQAAIAEAATDPVWEIDTVTNDGNTTTITHKTDDGSPATTTITPE